MSRRILSLFLSTVLAVDVLFLLIAGYYYPVLFQSLLNYLPYDNDIETAVILISCFFTAVVSSYLLFKLFLKALKSSLEWS
jgi:hypothetical protein